MEFGCEDKEIRMFGNNVGYNSVENLDPGVVQDKTPPQNAHELERLSESKSSSRNIYRECLKNHAANKGGNVRDGCGEFMPCGEEGSMEALKCAACSCHRNFHRREITIMQRRHHHHHPCAENNNNNNTSALVLHHLHLPTSLTSLSLNHRKPADGGGDHHWPTMPAAQLGPGSSVATDSSSEELNFKAHHYSSPDVAPLPPYVSSKKRFRTKFTQQQKEKMLEFAENLGWRIPREDDSQVQRFCAEVGIKRHVFKVWMHNNKTSSSSSSSSKKNNPQDSLIITT